MNTIIINGKRFEVAGRNISVRGDKLYVDGKLVTGDLQGKVEVSFKGDLASLECDSNVYITGNIRGDVSADGNVVCNDVGGNLKAGGNATCDDVDGDVTAGGNINCDKIKGSARAGGNIYS